MSGIVTEGIELLKFSDATKTRLGDIQENNGMIPAIYKDGNDYKNAKFPATDLEKSEYDAIVTSESEMKTALETQSVHSIFVKGTVTINSQFISGSKYISSDGNGLVRIKSLGGNYNAIKIFCHSQFTCTDASDINDPAGLYLTTIEPCDTAILNVIEGYVYEKYGGNVTPAGERRYWYSSGEIYVYPEPATKTKAGVVKVGSGLSVDNDGKISLDGKPFSEIYTPDEPKGNGIKNIRSEDHKLILDKEYFIKAGEREEGDKDEEFEAKEVISFNSGYRIKTVSYSNAFVCIDATEYTETKPFKVCLRLAFRHAIVDVFFIISSGGVSRNSVSCYYSNIGMQSLEAFNSITYSVSNGKIYARVNGQWTDSYDVTDAFITGLINEEKIKLTFDVPVTGSITTYAKKVSYPGLIGSNISEAAILTVNEGVISELEIDPDSTKKLFAIDGGRIVPLENIGSESNPVYVKDGQLKEMSLSIANNALLKIQSGVFSKSDANVGSQGKFVYLNNGQFREANAIVDVSQIINFTANVNIVKINGASVSYSNKKILPAESDWKNVDPATSSVYLIGSSESAIEFSSISSMSVGSVIEIFSKESNDVRLSVPNSQRVKWIDSEESSLASKTITVQKHATIVRLPDEVSTMVFCIMNEEV